MTDGDVHRRPPAGPWPRASTRGLAVLGWPVGHSLSPVMHNAALADAGLDLAYLALPTPPDRLAAVVGALGTLGFVGANVTVPHKQAVMRLCDRLTDEARLIGAVNTLTWRDDGLLEGHNTDAIGLQRALDEVGAPTGHAAMLGTGGAARAAVVAMVRRRMHVLVVGRRLDPAEEVAALGEELAEDLLPDRRFSDVRTDDGGVEVRPGAVGIHLDDPDPDMVAESVVRADLLVNATPLGMSREDLPPWFMSPTPRQFAYDLVYTPPDTPFLQAAAAVGAPAHHGLSMLVHQAAAAFEHWLGRPAPTDLMRDAAEAALAERT